MTDLWSPYFGPLAPGMGSGSQYDSENADEATRIVQGG
jgi:hypothetical protein